VTFTFPRLTKTLRKAKFTFRKALGIIWILNLTEPRLSESLGRPKFTFRTPMDILRRLKLALVRFFGAIRMMTVA